MRLRRSLALLGLAAKLSSQKKRWAAWPALDRTSSMIRSLDRNRYPRPNIVTTEQNLQAKGQPLEVATGTTACRGFQPLIKEKSGIGRIFRFSIKGRSGLCFGRPSSQSHKPVIFSTY